MIYTVLIILLIAADQISKIFVSVQGPGWHVGIIEGIFSLEYSKNSGAAFSSCAGEDWARPLFIALTCVVMPILYVAFLRLGKNRKWLKTSISFIIAGTIGNFIERLVFGEVTDFIYVEFFANFNIADIALTVGAIMLVVWFLFMDDDALIPLGRKKRKNG